MKLLHVADLHIGKRLGNVSLAEDQRHILAQIGEVAREEGAAALLVAGDIYDKAAPSAEAVALLDAFLSDISAAGIQVIAIPGNHDSAERVAYAQGLLEKQGVHFPPVYAGRLEPIVLEDEHGPVHFWPIPFLKPGDVRRFFPEGEVGDDYSRALRLVVRQAGVDPRERNIALSHQLVTASGRAPDRSEGEISLGGLDNVDVSAYDAFDYVALGHVHRSQRVGRDTVRYAGSPLKYSFSEARYPKSAVVVEVGPKAPGEAVGACVSSRLVPLAPLHDMREVAGTLAEVLERGRACQGRAEALDYLHVTLADSQPQLDAMARIRAVYPNALALDYGGAVRAARERRRDEAVDPAQVDVAELFALFFERQAGKLLTDAQWEVVRAEARSAAEESGEGGVL